MSLNEIFQFYKLRRRDCEKSAKLPKIAEYCGIVLFSMKLWKYNFRLLFPTFFKTLIIKNCLLLPTFTDYHVWNYIHSLEIKTLFSNLGGDGPMTHLIESTECRIASVTRFALKNVSFFNPQKCLYFECCVCPRDNNKCHWGKLTGHSGHLQIASWLRRPLKFVTKLSPAVKRVIEYSCSNWVPSLWTTLKMISVLRVWIESREKLCERTVWPADYKR